MAKVVHSNFVTLVLYLTWILGTGLSQERHSYPNSGSNDENIGSSYFYYQQPEHPRDCAEALNQCSINNVSGVYLIKPDGYPEPFEVFCDNLDRGGWTVIHRVQDGSVLFNRNWTEYKTGFGFLSQEFWIGNEKLSFLTNQNTYELRVDITSTDGLSFSITYNGFRISDEFSEYKLANLGEYSGERDEIDRFLCPTNREGWTYLYRNCSRRCLCKNGQITCEDYQCSPNAVCEERNNGSQCYCNAGYTGDGVNCTIDTPPFDCQDIYDRVSTESGIYKIKPTTWQREAFDVYCNMSDGGGWTVFQRRVDGSQNFHLYWSDYKNGFGRLEHDGEFWLGNEKLHSVTSQRNYELRIDFINRIGNPYFARYDSFSISDESDKYRLSRGTYSGNAGNSLNYNNGKAFTTRDRDNDGDSSNCASHSVSRCGTSCNINAGWWYGTCGYSLLNSPYGSACFYWDDLPGGECNIKYTEMKVRPT